jgi:hypothetical protein
MTPLAIESPNRHTSLAYIVFSSFYLMDSDTAYEFSRAFFGLT